MNRVITSIAVFGVVLAGTVFADAAFADDTMSHAAMNKNQLMKDCIEQQKTADVNMSKSQMKRLCKDKLKQQKATGDMPQQPPTDAPRN